MFGESWLKRSVPASNLEGRMKLKTLSSKNPPNFVSIAAWASGSEHWLVVNPAIKSVKELEGKVLATSRPKSADHGYQLVILERNGVDTRRVPSGRRKF